MDDEQLRITRTIVELADRIAQLPNSREKSLALTKLDECGMWIDKAFD